MTFEHSPLGSELKKQTEIAGKWYRGLGKYFWFDWGRCKTINKEEKDNG